MTNTLQQFLKLRLQEFNQISSPRRTLLEETAQIYAKEYALGLRDFIYICTHNSRRSHFAQVWSQIAALHFKLKEVATYSGGSEETAFFPSAVESLKRSGVDIKMIRDQKNPVYLTPHFDQQLFSKIFDHKLNPQENFIAIMVCDSADQNCPLVAGSKQRISLPYLDPKESDGSPHEKATYDERNAEICREMLFLHQKLSKLVDV